MIEGRYFWVSGESKFRPELKDCESEELFARISLRMALPDAGECEFADGLAHAH